MIAIRARSHGIIIIIVQFFLLKDIGIPAYIMCTTILYVFTFALIY